MRMVNERFPERSRYGFEMVDVRRTPITLAKAASIENLHRIKSLGFLANFRRFNLNANTCDLSTAVSQGMIAGSPRGSCRINRNGIKTDGRVREMFFLLRMAFWLGLVLVLLPRDRTPEADKLPQVGASEAVSAASAAVSDMSQFCKRQPAVCEVGGQAATVLTHRAQDGARKLYQIITDKRSSDHTGSIGEVENADAPPAETAPRDTLTPDDLLTEWRAPPAP
jgi:Family of unknown function (DUF5330)